MGDRDVLAEGQWARIEPLLPPVKGAMGRPCAPHRPVVEGIVYRYRAGVPWRDLPARFGPWQTVWKRHHKWSADGTWDRVLLRYSPMPTRSGIWIGGCRRIRRWCGRTSTLRTRRGRSRRRRPTQGATPNDKPGGRRRDEPADHGIGRSRGGLSTKAHLLVDGAGRPLVIVVSPGQAGDAPALLPMLAELRVARRGPGRPRTRPMLLRADKAYSARRHRQHLHRRGIKTVIPEPSDQAAHRRRRGSSGGRPISYDRAEYRGRNVIERGIGHLKTWRALATRYDKHALTYRGGLTLAAVLAWTR